jgi:DNA-directed RNA polymerase specialized sigma24 family protein
MSAAEPKPSLVERLFAEHRGALQTFFLRRIRSKADAPDLAQEVYGLSYRAIAAHLGVSPQMAKKYVAQALGHCRRRMARLG